MRGLKRRLRAIEGKIGAANLKEMTDAQLTAHLDKLPSGSPAWWEARITQICKRGSTLPLVRHPVSDGLD